MAWVRLDDGFPEHPKVQALNPETAWLFVQTLCYANRNLTDGFVPLRAATALAGARHRTMISALLSAGLWTTEHGGYHIHDYLDYQPSKAAVVFRRESDRNRKGIQSPRTQPRTQVSLDTGTTRRAGLRSIGGTVRVVTEGTSSE